MTSVTSTETTRTVTSAVESLQNMLKVFRAARSTYRTAIRQIDKHGERGVLALRVLLENHEHNIVRLEKELRRLGGTPAEGMDAWGLWARANERVSAFFGDASAIVALKDAEEHLMQVTTRSLDDLDEPTRALVRETILPSLARHEDLLDVLLESR